MSQYLSDGQFNVLYERLKVLLSRSRCSHTLRRTRHWLQSQNVDVRANIEKIVDIGGFCDCEVLMNVTPEEWSAQRDEALVTPDIVGEAASSAFVSRMMLQAVQHAFSFE